MTHYTKKSLHLPGYERYGAIVIEYDFDSGIQTVSRCIMLIPTHFDNLFNTKCSHHELETEY